MNAPATRVGQDRSEAAEYYEALWGTPWDDMKTFGPFSRHYRRIIMDLIRPLAFRSVLDIGCGQGSLLAEVCRVFPACVPYGIDISPLAIRLAEKKVPNGTFWALDVTQEHVGREFDLVLCSEVLEHLPDDTAALQNIARMTGRYLVVTTVQGRMRPWERQVGHVRNYAGGELVRKVKEAGLGINQVVEWGFPFYSPVYRNLLQLASGRGVTGQYGPIRRAIAGLIYHIFSLNSHRRGDEIFVLAAAGGEQA